MVKNQGTKQRVQRILVDCWQWETNGQCVKGDNCSFRHDVNKSGNRQVDEQPTKRSKKNDDKSALAMLKKGDWQER